MRNLFYHELSTFNLYYLYANIKKFDVITEEMTRVLNEELEIIERNKYEQFFLNAHKLVEKSIKLGYSTGFFGNIGNVFVAYLLGISDVNPLKHNVFYDLALNDDEEPYMNMLVAYKIYNDMIDYAKELGFEDVIIPDEGLDLIKDVGEIDYNDINLITDVYYKYYDFDVEGFVPKTFDELVKYYELGLGTGVWEDNGQLLVDGRTKFKEIPFLELISNRDDVYKILLAAGLNKEGAKTFIELIPNNAPSKLLNENYKMFIKILKDLKTIPSWYIWSLERVRYLFPKIHVISLVIRRMKIESIKY